MTSVFLISVLLCLSSGLLAANGAPPPCPPNWTKFGSRCFGFYNQPKTWIDAETTCIAAGGNLASIHSAEENKFLIDYIIQVNGRDTYSWIGGHDIAKEGTWMWTDGYAFNYKSWLAGQPDNASVRGENCIMRNWDEGKWTDWPCNNQIFFMCSKNLGNLCV